MCKLNGWLNCVQNNSQSLQARLNTQFRIFDFAKIPIEPFALIVYEKDCDYDQCPVSNRYNHCFT
jgi:hypothetical protein